MINFLTTLLFLVSLACVLIARKYLIKDKQLGGECDYFTGIRYKEEAGTLIAYSIVSFLTGIGCIYYG